jgi:hypothetical protein
MEYPESWDKNLS